jgi:hypothetical protein
MTARWNDPPPRERWDDDPLAPARGIARGLLISALLWALLILTAVQLHGQQVAPTVPLTTGVTSTLVANTSGAAQSVTVGLFYPRSDGVTPDTLRPVSAVVSPRSFVLQPGDHQVVRLRVRGAVPAIARLLTCFTPTIRPVGRVAVVSRLCLNALATGGGP